MVVLEEKRMANLEEGMMVVLWWKLLVNQEGENLAVQEER